MKPALIIGGILAFIAAMVIGHLYGLLADERVAHGKTVVAYADYRTEVNGMALEAAERGRAVEAKWRSDFKKLDNDWSEKYAGLQTKYSNLDAASKRMSGQLATFTTASKDLASTATTAAEREAVSAAFDLLSNMHRELGEREVTLAKSLDRSYAEGLACQAFYEVTEPQAGGS